MDAAVLVVPYLVCMTRVWGIWGMHILNNLWTQTWWGQTARAGF